MMASTMPLSFRQVSVYFQRSLSDAAQQRNQAGTASVTNARVPAQLPEKRARLAGEEIRQEAVDRPRRQAQIRHGLADRATRSAPKRTYNFYDRIYRVLKCDTSRGVTGNPAHSRSNSARS
jgi:hypothetical protein